MYTHRAECRWGIDAVVRFVRISGLMESSHRRQRLREAASCRRHPPRAIPNIGRSDCLGGIVAVRKISGGKRPEDKDPRPSILDRAVSAEDVRNRSRCCQGHHTAPAQVASNHLRDPCSYNAMSSQYYGSLIMSNQNIEHTREIRYDPPCSISDLSIVPGLCREQSLTFA